VALERKGITSGLDYVAVGVELVAMWGSIARIGNLELFNL